MSDSVGRGSPYVMVRMTEEMKRWLKHQAVDNRRSLSNEVLIRLELSRSLEEAGKQQESKT